MNLGARGGPGKRVGSVRRVERVRMAAVACITATLVVVGLGSAAVGAPTPVAGSTSAAPSGATTSATTLAASPLAALPVRTVSTNGAWCWFQDHRAVFTSDGHLLVGSTASATGTAGAARGGAVEVATVDPATGAVERTDRLHGAGQYAPDDHAAPAFTELPDGRVVAAWSGHNDDPYVHSATLDPGDAAWTLNSRVRRDPVATYNNLIWLPEANGGKGLLYDFHRAGQGGVNVLISADRGRTWPLSGVLVHNKPYYPYTKFASDGKGRIWFVSSNANPQSAPGTSVRAGYLEGSTIHASNGKIVGDLSTGGTPWSSLTLVRAGVAATEGFDTDVWTSDIAVGPAGPVAALTVKYRRPPNVAGRTYAQEYFYARWTGTAWVSRRIGFGGSELYAGQPSYSGNLTIDHTDVGHVYLSSNVDPVTGAELRSLADNRSHWEIYEARSTDRGDTWALTAVTHDSAVDNLRPIAVNGHGRAALLWMRGSYPDFYTFDTDIVGVFTGAPTALPAALGTRVARAAAVVAGNWTGTASDGLFVVGDDPLTSGFLLPSGRNQKRAFVQVPLVGTYVPHRVDQNGDGRSEVLLVDRTPDRAPSVRRNLLVSLGAAQAVSVVPSFTPVDAVPVVGDFNGDLRTDAVWYRPGPGLDTLRLSFGSTGYIDRSVTLDGLYRYAVGDLDADGRDDIVWHAPGSAADHIWRFGAAGTFQDRVLQVQGSYQPLVADLDGNGADDILWQSGRADVPSIRWLYVLGAFPTHLVRTSPAAVTPAVAGDFDGDGRVDLFFNRAGDLPDTWWWSATP